MQVLFFHCERLHVVDYITSNTIAGTGAAPVA